MTTETGSDAMLPDDYDPSPQLAEAEAASAEEDARVETMPADDDPGQDYPEPEPPEDDGDVGGFDPLPPETP